MPHATTHTGADRSFTEKRAWIDRIPDAKWLHRLLDINSDYRGEVQVLLVNLGDRAFTVARGERIAQLVIARRERITLVETAAASATHRGAGGFGSTGRAAKTHASLSAGPSGHPRGGRSPQDPEGDGERVGVRGSKRLRPLNGKSGRRGTPD